MGRLLHDLGYVSQKDAHKNAREAAQAGKVRTCTKLASRSSVWHAVHQLGCQVTLFLMSFWLNQKV
jgi:hypothetical protein